MMNRKNREAHMRRTTSLLVCLILLAAPFVGATGLAEDPLIVAPIGEIDHSQNIKLSAVEGMPVTLDGERVGTVRDAVVDIGEGIIARYVVEFSDESIGSAEARYPLPAHAFGPREGELALLTDNETYFNNMPTLSEVRRASRSAATSDWDHWMYVDANTSVTVTSPEAEDRRFYLQRFRYRYGGGPEVVPSATMRASELFETQILDADGRTLGSITDAVANLDTAQVLLLNLQPEIDASEDAYLIPLSAFTGNSETTTISYDMDDYGLTGPSGYSGEWPAIADDSYHRSLERFWNRHDVDTRYAVGMRIVPVRLTPATFITNFELFTQERGSPGRIVDMLVEPDGAVSYAIVEFSGFLGTGGRRIPVPLAMLTISPVSEAAVLNVRAANLEEFPSYPAGQTIDTGSQGWREPITTYWNNLFDVETGEMDVGEIPTVQSPREITDSRPLPASAVLGFSVVSPDGNRIGGVSRLYVDLVDGRVAFALVAVDGTGLNPLEVPVPLSVLEWRSADERLVLDADGARLDRAPGSDGLPVAPGVEFLEQLADYWNGD